MLQALWTKIVKTSNVALRVIFHLFAFSVSMKILFLSLFSQKTFGVD